MYIVLHFYYRYKVGIYSIGIIYQCILVCIWILHFSNRIFLCIFVYIMYRGFYIILSSWISVLLVIVHSNVCVSMESWCNIYMSQFILHILRVYIQNNCIVFFLRIHIFMTNQLFFPIYIFDTICFTFV